MKVTLQTCAPENIRSYYWGDEQTVKRAQMVSEDPHRREQKYLLETPQYVTVMRHNEFPILERDLLSEENIQSSVSCSLLQDEWIR